MCFMDIMDFMDICFFITPVLGMRFTGISVKTDLCSVPSKF